LKSEAVDRRGFAAVCYGMFRRTLGLILALALAIGGAYLFIMMVFFPQAPVKVMFILGAGMMCFLGVYWLWADYIKADPKPED
jgi:hypothetical protein